MQVFSQIKRRLLDLLLPLEEREEKILSHTAESLRNECREAAPCRFPSHRAALSYTDPLARTFIRLIKYRGNKDAASLAASLVARLLDETPLPHAAEPLIVVPIPLFPPRERKRGFNQSARIAENLAALPAREKGPALAYEPLLLVRTRDTGSQTKLSGAARQENMRGALALASGADVRSRDILVLDDVTTTGATFREAERVLLEAGARSVVCLAVAH